jgi:hypothetical protein
VAIATASSKVVLVRISKPERATGGTSSPTPGDPNQAPPISNKRQPQPEAAGSKHLRQSRLRHKSQATLLLCAPSRNHDVVAGTGVIRQSMDALHPETGIELCVQIVSSDVASVIDGR